VEIKPPNKHYINEIAVRMKQIYIHTLSENTIYIQIE